MKVKAYLSIGYSNADQEETIDIDDSEIEGMTEKERDEYINEVVQCWADNYIEVGWNLD